MVLGGCLRAARGAQPTVRRQAARHDVRAADVEGAKEQGVPTLASLTFVHAQEDAFLRKPHTADGILWNQRKAQPFSLDLEL